MIWARSSRLGSAPVLALSAALAAIPATRARAAEPRSAIDLDHMVPHGDHWVAPLATGGDVQLTLDPELQQAALKILASANPVRGGMIVIDAHTGQVLAWAETARDGHHHQTLTTARMPAASVFKLVTTAALFETTTLSPHDEVCIAGGMHDIERRHLDAPRGEGVECSPFAYAIGFSKNAVFAQLATHRLLRSSLIDTAHALGFNGHVPFELDVPVGALEVPYGDLEFARTAAGFQGSTLSPLGAAYLASVIAHGGEATRIRVTAPDSADSDEPAEIVERVLKPRTADRIRRMMEVTVRSGTCRHAFSDESGHRYLGNIRVSGKTGTLRPEASESARDPRKGEGMTSWFMGFAPSQKPEIIVSVMLENGSVWRHKANELARDLLRNYFHGHGRPWVSDPLGAPAAERVATTQPAGAVSATAARDRDTR
ncbi:MAG TPA: penicillin-binding transpeptidase domain-containing protein [Polyangiaceae bacterium]|jgi:cell division protein FtsI/penicillin-binding protein 2|nr:penicillin-binding transpeptidase domain-containing protein [Polyangiaceae bacterium]